jgi:serine/threonine protein kinase
MTCSFGPFSESVVRRYTFDVLRGLEYLHLNGIMHRDIKVGGLCIASMCAVAVLKASAVAWRCNRARTFSSTTAL